jgi:hypothetical protein
MSVATITDTELQRDVLKEVLAEVCNADFCTCVYRCTVLQTGLPFVYVELHLPQI